jgi:hypothetical protein
VAATLPAAAARADDHVAFVTGGGPIAAIDRVLAYSTQGGDGQYHLMLSTDGSAGAPATGVAPSPTPFDVALGRDASGSVVATYSRNQRGYVLKVGDGTERRIRGIGAPATSPVVSGDRLAWIVPGAPTYDGCDRLEVRSGAGRPRVVSRACRKLSGVQISGKDVVWSSTDLSSVGSGSPTKSSSIKAFTFGGDVALSGRGTPRRAPSGVTLQGPMALAGPRAYYLIPGHDEQGCAPGQGVIPIPCELVSTTAAALAPSATRQLPPELSVAYAPRVRPPAGTPLTITGRMQRRTVRAGRTLATAPVAGEVVDVLDRVGGPAGEPATPVEAFQPANLSATTGADGRWSVQAPAPDRPFFSAQIRSTGLLAGRGTVGYCPANTVSQGRGFCLPAR